MALRVRTSKAKLGAGQGSVKRTSFSSDFSFDISHLTRCHPSQRFDEKIQRRHPRLWLGRDRAHCGDQRNAAGAGHGGLFGAQTRCRGTQRKTRRQNHRLSRSRRAARGQKPPRRFHLQLSLRPREAGGRSSQSRQTPHHRKTAGAVVERLSGDSERGERRRGENLRLFRVPLLKPVPGNQSRPGPGPARQIALR